MEEKNFKEFLEEMGDPATRDWGYKVEFPLTEKELAKFYQFVNTLDFDYFECCLNASQIREEDIEKIAVVKYALEQMNDVIASRISWYEECCGLKLPKDDALYEIIDKYRD